MRLATYNIRHGARPGRPTSNRAMASAVASLRADVIALQEVDRRVLRSWFADQPRRAARRSGTTALFAPARRLGPGGSYGNALLVRGTVERTRTLVLPGPGERRVALLAVVVVGDQRLTVVSTHLQNRRDGVPADAADVQLEALLHEWSGWPLPGCVMGDLNLRAERVVPLLTAAGLVAAVSGPTFPATAPRIRIDWIASRGLGSCSTVVPELMTSDHRPLVADFDDAGRGTSGHDGIPHEGGPWADPSAEP